MVMLYTMCFYLKLSEFPICSYAANDAILSLLFFSNAIRNFIALSFKRMQFLISKTLRDYSISLYLYQEEGSNYPFLFLLCYVSCQASPPYTFSGCLSDGYL